MQNIIKNTVRMLAVSLSATALLGAAGAHAQSCPPITTLAQLPFAGTVSSNDAMGFAFDDENLDVDATPRGPTTTVESTLRIFSLDPMTGTFKAIMYGPWSGHLPNGKPVTGKIQSTNNNYFSVKFQYQITDPVSGFPLHYTFNGAIRADDVASTTGNLSTCQPTIFMAGTYTYKIPVSTAPVQGPAPFSGTMFVQVLS